jgi:hypothetical protein
MAHNVSQNARQASMSSARSHQAVLSSSISVKQVHVPQIVDNALGQQVTSVPNATKDIIYYCLCLEAAMVHALPKSLLPLQLAHSRFT